MRKLNIITCLSLLSILSVSLNAQVATIDLTSLKQPISGFGGAHYPEWGSGLTEDQVDKVFGNNPWQIGLQILRLPVPTDTSVFSMEVAAPARAKSKGAILFATPWSPPPSMKTNKNVIKGKLDTAFYDDFAHYLDSFGKYMASNNAALHAISIQNEPDFLPSYASCEYKAIDFIKFLSEQGSKITGVKIMAPESFQFRHVLSDSILNDSAAASKVDIIGGHIYGGGIQDYPLARQKGKEVWMTEYYVSSTNWSGDIETAKLINDCMQANYNGFVYWTIRNQTGFLNDAGDILKRGYVIREKKNFYPTELGLVVVDLLKKYFYNIIDVEFTAEMEQKLDDVEEGDVNWVNILKDFYMPFQESLEVADHEIEHIQVEDEVTNEVCELCGRNMVIKMGRYGKFLACPGFPECRCS
jgi:O-glycosyl hydrolase